MSKKKEYKEITTYKTYYIDIKSIMKKRNISQNILIKMTNITPKTIRAYYHSKVTRIDLDVISRICAALGCEISDILKIN